MAPTVPIDYTGQRESKKLFKKDSGDMMGKSRKVFKGYASGIVPDFSNAVETMAESEGFGSSGRVDTERTASEDSCAPKRKSFCLNADGYDRYGVPIQVMSLSKMSRSERRGLGIRLRNELEQIRTLQKKIASVDSNILVHSPASDIQNCTDGQRRSGSEISQRYLTEAVVPPGKKKAALGRNGPLTKGSGAKRPKPMKQAVPSDTSTVMLMKQCETLLNRLMSHQHGWVFNTPVDVVKLKIPDYFTVIKQPMDLGTVKSKLHSGEYLSPLQFAADVRLTFKNAMTYNPPGNDVHFMAQTLSKFFEVRWKPLEKKIPIIEEEPLPSKSSVILETETDTPLAMPPSKKKKVAPLENKVKPEPVKRVMSDADKHKLTAEIEALLAELPENIIDFLREKSFNGSQVSEDEIEIDLDALNDDILYELRKLLDEYLLEKQKKQAKGEPCEMELHDESGFSNSSMQPCKGNDPADEEVDIGGNDPPASSFPPVEIEKDRARRSNKCSSSSSSSSDSDSSSCDSGSSSGDELDAGKDSVPKTVQKATTAASGGRTEQEDELDLPETRDSLADLLTSEKKSISAELDDHREEESAEPERQVSPEKLYRAALLRGRFADIILKAQEKSLEKGEVRDPERLKLEREEFERRRREEKARLQAEAKAAEEARRRADAEAAAEAKRKRELEREAARQALQKMEKTVEINENSRFLEDLELFKAAPDEQLESFIEVTSPGHSENVLGSFKFKASTNPLEQLGLYIKDDEEEEETEPHSVPVVSNDPEEGEID
ncbi:PREDICTED: transcription factor GTE10-like isoform X2 [Nicotiana attenuata]|uniref:Transcription factor gte10 n=1 Tax=Nicotiana attenuata TaxID=49451 RepID=A0A314KYZ7_NICAT|nr:PREDICTED: transcription factor GTE10-like isoform X2 [Nicotiana attenuata]OIT34385.1 transcription factor gte10 [Nicotiana attenuata]